MLPSKKSVGSWIRIVFPALYDVTAARFMQTNLKEERNKDLELTFSDGSTQTVSRRSVLTIDPLLTLVHFRHVKILSYCCVVMMQAPAKLSLNHNNETPEYLYCSIDKIFGMIH